MVDVTTKFSMIVCHFNVPMNHSIDVMVRLPVCCVPAMLTRHTDATAAKVWVVIETKFKAVVI